MRVVWWSSSALGLAVCLWACVDQNPTESEDSGTTPAMDQGLQPPLDASTLPQPEPQPTPQPAPQPSPQPAPQPSAEPAPQPSAEPAPQPSAEPAPQPAAEPAPEPEQPPPPPPSDDLTFLCGVVDDVDCRGPEDNSLRDCVRACEEMAECLREICTPERAATYDQRQIDACALQCRHADMWPDADDVRRLDCDEDEMIPGLCASIPALGPECGCAGPPDPEPAPQPEPQPAPQPEPQPAPNPEPPPVVDCDMACDRLVMCLGDICEPATLMTFGGQIRMQCMQTCNDDPARFADQGDAECNEVNREACMEEPLLGVICTCP